MNFIGPPEKFHTGLVEYYVHFSDDGRSWIHISSEGITKQISKKLREEIIQVISEMKRILGENDIYTCCGTTEEVRFAEWCGFTVFSHIDQFKVLKV